MTPQPTSTTTGHPELLLRVARGEQDAFAALYDQTVPVVYGTALKVLRDPDLAAETTQDVMVELWRTAGRYDPSRGSVRAWVATLAHRRAVDRVRAEQSYRARAELDASRDHRPVVDEVVEEVERRDDADRLTRCLDSLTTTQRRSIELAYWGGLTYREVAEDLAAALPTVKSRIRDGLMRLRTCLEGRS